MRISLYLIVFLFIVSPKFSKAQVFEGFEWQNPIPSATHVTDIHFVDEQKGWATAGYLLKSTNGGESWEKQSVGNNNPVYSVHFVNSQTGWLSGVAGAIYKTNDGGATWVEQNSNTTKNLSTIYFFDAQYGWAVGEQGTIVRTTNGGSTWVATSDADSANLKSVFFTSSQVGWVTGPKNYILKTTDGGVTWNQQMLVSSNITYFSDIHFTDSQRGWVCGGGVPGLIFRTEDGGISWDTSLWAGGTQFISIQFTDAQRGWAISGNLSRLYHTTDGGLTWTSKPFGKFNSTKLFFLNDQVGWVVGGGGSIYKTTDGGTSWVNKTKGPSKHLFSIQMLNQQVGWVAGDSGLILKTTNGGQNWLRKNSGTNSLLNSLYFIDDQHGWAVTDDSTVIKTADGGETWTPNFIPNAYLGYMPSVFFSNEQKGWVGTAGKIYTTSDGGSNWTYQPHSAGRLAYIRFNNALTGWAVGEGGAYLKTVDGGSSWTLQNTGLGSSTTLYSIYFLNETMGWIVGKNTCLKTIDGGNTWVEKPTGFNGWFTSIGFSDSLHGYIGGADPGLGGMILKTTDGGNSWSKINTNGIWINGISCVSDGSFWLAGDVGTIVHSSSSVLARAMDVPANLLSLFPNPARSKISLFTDSRILEVGLVDGLGNQLPVKVDINNEIDISVCTPGIYWLRIQTSAGVSTHKIIRE